MLTERYAQAIAFATKAHDGQFRKTTTIPYIHHPIAVSTLVLKYGGDEDQAIGGLLHDTVEDCDAALEEVEEAFGKRVSAIVAGCTDGIPEEGGQDAPWLRRKTKYMQHLETASDDVLIVSACDKLHNISSIAEDLRNIGPAVFDRFEPSRDQTLWYYGSLTEIFSRRLGQPELVRALQLEMCQITNGGQA